MRASKVAVATSSGSGIVRAIGSSIPQECADRNMGPFDDSNTITGTKYGDWLIAWHATGPQLILGLGGYDLVVGWTSADCLVGGTQGDVMEGGSGDDVVLGGDGWDIISGGLGADYIDGGDGWDKCFVTPGDTVVNCEVELPGWGDWGHIGCNDEGGGHDRHDGGGGSGGGSGNKDGTRNSSEPDDDGGEEDDDRRGRPGASMSPSSVEEAESPEGVDSPTAGATEDDEESDTAGATEDAAESDSPDATEAVEESPAPDATEDAGPGEESDGGPARLTVSGSQPALVVTGSGAAVSSATAVPSATATPTVVAAPRRISP
ncbi:MAG: hypothetical protein IT303_11345 [Dehalococcoidia bacterium]|nr:hypothetical protein [Dehalococcoidia bacterium]